MAINVLIITFFKYKEIDRLNNEARLYSYIKSYNPNYKLPHHIIISKNYKKFKKFKIFGEYNNKFVYFSEDYIKKDMNRFVFTLLLWEFALSFLLIVMVYAVFRHFSKKEEEHKEFLKFLLGAISHKFGNFLSVQRLNLELIETESKKPLERLKDAYMFMEKDFKNMVKMIKDMETESAVKYSVEDVIKKTLDIFKENITDKEVSLSLADAKITHNGNDFYNVIHELIENSVKYSEKYIHIRVLKKNKMLYVVIANDIGDKKSGSGFGLSLVKYLTAKNRWNFETKIVGKRFQAALIVKL